MNTPIRRGYYRTVRNNTVRILGKTLHCKNLNKGELDGKRFYFKIYKHGREQSPWNQEGLAYLWGTEAYAKAVNKGASKKMLAELYKEDGKLLAPNGYLDWYWWTEKHEEQPHSQG